MIYKVLNKVFGWDYVWWKNTIDRGVARIHKDKNGNVFYWRYKNIKIADLITDEKNVLWLTCEPSKYLKPNQSKGVSSDSINTT